MALIDTVRQALRIKSTALDNEIMVLIEACKVDMAMAGVSRIDEGDPSFTAACIQYCKANFGQDSEGSTRERWEKCYKTLRDSMSMSREYGCLQNPEEKAEVAPVQPQESAEERRAVLMLYKDEITLASVSTKRDKAGFPEADVQLTEVFADVQSAKRREFYEALRAGVAMEITCRVRSIDYGRQKYVRWEGMWYRVVRAYRVEDWTELNCEEIKSLKKWMTEVDADADYQ